MSGFDGKLVVLLMAMLCFSTQVKETVSCYPDGGETGPATKATLKRVWCQTYTKKICFTVYYPLKKGVFMKTSNANRTYGADVSVKFYGKAVCIAYFYKEYKWSHSLNRHVLDFSSCRKSCFSDYMFNRKEKRQKAADLFGKALEWSSNYQLIVQGDNHNDVGPSGNLSWLAMLLTMTFSACLL